MSGWVGCDRKQDGLACYGLCDSYSITVHRELFPAVHHLLIAGVNQQNGLDTLGDVANLPPPLMSKLARMSDSKRAEVVSST